MKEIIVLEWTFTPPDYFEEPIHIVRDNHEITIENGKITARIEAQYYDSESDSRMKFQELLNNWFLGVLIVNLKPFKLSNSSMVRIHPNGRRTCASQGSAKISGGGSITADFVVTDSNGKVIRNSRKERIERRKALIELVEKYIAHNPILQNLLNSLATAFREPDNELLYLYEIREMLSKEFDGEKMTRQVLNITKKSWWRFGRLANDEPIKQGRHRGKYVGVLRHATEGELIEARTFAQELIEKYLDYLDNK